MTVPDRQDEVKEASPEWLYDRDETSLVAPSSGELAIASGTLSLIPA